MPGLTAAGAASETLAFRDMDAADRLLAGHPRWAEKVGQPDGYAYQSRASRTAMQLVLRLWPAILRLGRRLLIQEQMTYDEVVRLLKPAHRRKAEPRRRRVL